MGGDFPVGVRLCVDERFWSGIAPPESLEVAARLEETGQVDYIQSSLGTYYNLHLVLASMHTPMGHTVELAGQLKSRVKLPVFVGYQIAFPAMAESVLADGQADAVGFVRALICDPDLAAKAKAGRLEDIRHCVKDNQGCTGRISQSKALGCILNPRVGYEPLREGDRPVPPPQLKKVMVVGAGPAGLMAGLTAGERGHQVAVFEREKDVGRAGKPGPSGRRPGQPGRSNPVFKAEVGQKRNFNPDRGRGHSGIGQGAVSGCRDRGCRFQA